MDKIGSFPPPPPAYSQALREVPRLPSCCLCCNVRTGTMVLAVYHIILNVIVIAATIYALVAKDLFDIESKLQITPTYAAMTITLAVALIFISASLLHGTRKHRPGLLLPFFCVQVFDLGLATISTVYYATDFRLMHLKLQELYQAFNLDELSISQPVFNGVFIGTTVFLYLLKFYFATCVWKCYKFLQITENLRGQPEYYSQGPAVADSKMKLLSESPPAYE
ncbi:Lysosomal-associated transmembrane protein 4B [Trichoplax sp. H2]|nr:Lysosomal-associated transmembrane protein 4B [Trichoplax sp. H2]|eukprot:RDD41307.1 Lysosomal-associated transmembrane protein 4B [Trichoplax sp. H2]